MTGEHPRDSVRAAALGRVGNQSAGRILRARVALASGGLLADGPELFADLAAVDLESRRPSIEHSTMGGHARELRLERGLTQAHLALRAKLSIDTIARIERDQHTPSGPTLVKLCGALRITVRTFYDGFCRAEVGTDREALDLIRLLTPTDRSLALGLLRVAVESRSAS